MDHVEVHFGMRLRGRFTLEELAIRLRNMLLCIFTPTEDPRYPQGALVAEALFLHLMLTCQPHDRPQVEGKEYLYTLSASSLDAGPRESTSEINLAEWMLAKLHLHDSPDWYIPTAEELHAEATKDPLGKR